MLNRPPPVALITGAARGIGLAIACQLADRGFQIAINTLPDDAQSETALARLRQHGEPLSLPGDVCEAATRERLIADTIAHFGGLDCLVNNAGVSVLQRGDLLDVSEASFDRCLAVNAKASFFLAQAAARAMLRTRARGHRSLIFISSSNATAVSIERGEYCVSKAAAAMGAQLFAHRLADRGIQVFDLRPGVIATEMTAPSRDKYDRLIAAGLTSEGRWGEVEDVARCAAACACGELPYTTGQVLSIDGGLSAVRF